MGWYGEVDCELVWEDDKLYSHSISFRFLLIAMGEYACRACVVFLGCRIWEENDDPQRWFGHNGVLWGQAMVFAVNWFVIVCMHVFERVLQLVTMDSRRAIEQKRVANHVLLTSNLTTFALLFRHERDTKSVIYLNVWVRMRQMFFCRTAIRTTAFRLGIGAKTINNKVCRWKVNRKNTQYLSIYRIDQNILGSVLNIQRWFYHWMFLSLHFIQQKKSLVHLPYLDCGACGKFSVNMESDSSIIQSSTLIEMLCCGKGILLPGSRKYVWFWTVLFHGSP